jgi:hypothetical protein
MTNAKKKVNFITVITNLVKTGYEPDIYINFLTCTSPATKMMTPPAILHAGMLIFLPYVSMSTNKLYENKIILNPFALF